MTMTANKNASATNRAGGSKVPQDTLDRQLCCTLPRPQASPLKLPLAAIHHQRELQGWHLGWGQHAEQSPLAAPMHKSWRRDMLLLLGAMQNSPRPCSLARVPEWGKPQTPLPSGSLRARLKWLVGRMRAASHSSPTPVLGKG
uniref:Uncharacterized protein n=1 Tax=Chelydra serpentina TaxID=8475 RepID=A0A8C3SME0_CHESE